MPKKVFESKGFTKGVISTVDSLDIDENSCVHNLDCSNVTDGSIEGVYEDRKIFINGNFQNPGTVFKNTVKLMRLGDDLIIFNNDSTVTLLPSFTQTRANPHAGGGGG